MRLSTYVQSWSYPEDRDYRLCYSLKDSSLALVPEEEFQKVENGTISPELRETLGDLGMLVDDPVEERRTVYRMPAEINRLDPTVKASIILGLACNFNCVYCYEGSLKTGESMSDETIAGLVDFLEHRLEAGSKKKLSVNFYGGEPLLYVNRIKVITKPLVEFTTRRNIEFSFALVTNGSLLTPAVVEELKPFGLAGARITVDGPAEIHDRLRPFKSGLPSFGVILKNIKSCCEQLKIGFGGNYTETTYRRLPELLNMLENLGLGPGRLDDVQFHPVMQTEDKYSNPEFTGGCVSVNEPWVAEAVLWVREEVLRRGYWTPRMSPSPCMVDLDDALTVNWDGRLYKCVALIGYEDYAIGDVWRGEDRDRLSIYHRENWRRNKECPECGYLPLCFGGCRYAEFQRTGSMAGVDCQRRYLDKALEGIVLQDVRYGKVEN